jgi:dUTP pyrophosphatase
MATPVELKKRRLSSADNTESADVAPVIQLLIKRLSDKGRIPTRGSALAAGYDLYRYTLKLVFIRDIDANRYSAEKAVVPARGKAMVTTGISMAVPVGTYGRVAPRSGLGQLCSIGVILLC